MNKTEAIQVLYNKLGRDNLIKAIAPMTILEFPELRQVFNYDCGVCSLQACLCYYGIEVREDELIKKLKAKHTDIFDNGVKEKDIQELSNYLGVECIIETGITINQLKKHIDNNYPVILLLQAYRDYTNTTDYKKDYKDGHYVVAIGYTNDRIIFEDPSSFTRCYLTYKELKDRWHGVNDENKPDSNNVSLVFIGEPVFRQNEIKHME